MTNPFAQFVKSPDSPEGGNPFSAFANSPVTYPEEQSVIERVNNPNQQTPVFFGLTEMPEAAAKGFEANIRTSFRGLVAGQALQISEAIPETLANIPIPEEATEKEKARSQAARDYLGGLANAFKDAGNRLFQKNKTDIEKLNLARPEGFLSGGAYDVGGAFGSMLPTIGATVLTRNPSYATAYMFALQDSQTYKELEDSGLPPEEKRSLAAKTAVGVSAIEQIGGRFWLHSVMESPVTKRIISRMAGQGAEEAAQTGVEETVLADVRKTPPEEIAKNMAYNFFIGMIAAAPISATISAMEETGRNMGLPPEEAKKMAQTIVDNKENLNEAALEILNKEISGLTDDSIAKEQTIDAVGKFEKEQQGIEKAIADGGTQDPQIAAKILMKTATPEAKAAIESLPKNFTMEQLQEVIKRQAELALEASSANTLISKVSEKPKESAIEFSERISKETGVEIGLHETDFGLYLASIKSLDPNQGEGTKAMREITDYADSVGKNISLTPTSDYGADKARLVEFYKRFGFVENKGKNKTQATSDAMIRTAKQLPVEVAKGDEKRAVYQQVLDAERQRTTIGEKAADLGEDVKRMVGNALTPISTRLKNISPKLKTRLRKFEFDLSAVINKDQATLEPFLAKFKSLNMADKVVLDFAMKNGDQQIIDEIAKANGMEAEISALRKMLDDIYKRASEVGLDVGYIEGYFPRHVINSEKLLAYFGKTDEWGQISQAIREKEIELGSPLDADAKAELINTLLRGYGKSQITLAKPGNLKARKLDTISPDINKFYASTDQALIRYVAAINNNIETRRFLGKGSKTAGLYDNINDSIGWFVMQEMADGNVKPSQEIELTEILQARFKPGRIGAFWRTYKNVEYASTMGTSISAITQLGDLAFGMYKNGVYRTIKVLPRAIAGRSVVTREDINVEKIAQEFADETTMGKAVRTIFKLTGFEKMDAIGKETLINGALDRYRQQAKKPTQEFRESLELILGEQAEQTIADLKNGKITDNVKLLLFNELLDIQPVALSEMPVSYLKMGNGKILYMLKTFTIKQFDIYRNEVFSQIRTNPARGLTNLTRLLAFFVMMNASADFLKDLLMGRETEPEEHVINNIMRVVGVSKFQVYTARREGIGTATGKTILPPFSVIDRGYKDMAELAEEGELDIEDMESIQNVPIAGKFYYWWMGAGADK